MSRQPSNSTLESPPPAAARPHRKPQADLYTILLVLALIAVLVAILFLYIYMKSYNNDAKAPPVAMVHPQVSLIASSLFPGL